LTFAGKVYPSLGHKVVRNLTRSDIENWKREMAERSSKGDANRSLAYLKAALTFAFDHAENQIPSNLAWKGVKAYPGVGKSRCDFYLDPEQVQRLLAVTSGGLHDLIKVSFLTGLRPPHEAAGIRCQDFDAERGIMRIVRSKVAKREPITLSSE